ncbi:MAG: bifunctional isocitrate dehydrogenase kinase/phosphatase [Bacteroidota bacterium]
MSPSEIAQVIMEGFDEYLAAFKQLTKGAQALFEARDWKGMQRQSQKRLALYKQKVPITARKVKRKMGPEFDQPLLWKSVKAAFLPLSLGRHYHEISQTYFNSVCRKVIGNLGADERLMFVQEDHEQREYWEAPPTYRRHNLNHPLPAVLRQVLLNHQVDAPFEEVDRDVQYLIQRLEQEVLAALDPEQENWLDVLQPNFYRNKVAYIVGRISLGETRIPFVVPMLHREKGVFADALLTNEDELSIIFSYTRSYFLVEIDVPFEVVQFLRSMLPRKPYGDIYNSIGFSKHGKTELYRNFIHHLEYSDDSFIVAPGTRGMVMAVFTLPSYPIVFKLIKDHFDPPKVTNKAHVRSRYKMVSRHDRVGRMADTHEFVHFAFPKDRFTPELLAELLEVAPSVVEVTETEVIIHHLYTERRMTPMNIFFQTANLADAEEVADEYGNTIKQLAAANIFPGDMMLKNFGVTRHKRVVFYDYDEIGFLTEYIFREMPKSEDPEDIYANAPWFAVGPKDVFPEQFKYFLLAREDVKDVFYGRHSDLFGVDFWKEMQQRQQREEILDVFPYRQSRRFARREGDDGLSLPSGR